MKKRVTKEPYEGYKLPASSEKGGQFVDFIQASFIVGSYLYPSFGKIIS